MQITFEKVCVCVCVHVFDKNDKIIEEAKYEVDDVSLAAN